MTLLVKMKYDLLIDQDKKKFMLNYILNNIFLEDTVKNF